MKHEPAPRRRSVRLASRSVFSCQNKLYTKEMFQLE